MDSSHYWSGRESIARRCRSILWCQAVRQACPWWAGLSWERASQRHDGGAPGREYRPLASGCSASESTRWRLPLVRHSTTVGDSLMMARAVQISANGRESASTPATSRDSCAESELTRSEVTDSAGPDTGIPTAGRHAV